ncbi:protein rep [Bacillus velezensis]|uniref:protein rep n=1 Tax=Bacillus velezensis TaxID=492670 RepID=UPI00358DD4E8
MAYHNKLIVEEANRQYGCGWIFLTLTVRNVAGEELKPKISDMMKGFNRLMKYKRVDTAVLGYFRALEITKNHEEEYISSAFSCVIACEEKYFRQKLYQAGRMDKYLEKGDETGLYADC